MPMSALARVSASWESAPDHSCFFMRNQVRSDTSPKSAHISGLVRRQISARRAKPSIAEDVRRSRVAGSEKLTGDAGSPGSFAGLKGVPTLIFWSFLANWHHIY